MFVLALLPLAGVISCGPLPDGFAGFELDLDGLLLPESTCEPQNVQSIPEAGLIRSTTTISANTTGIDSGLGDVLSLVGLVADLVASTPVDTVDYLVDAEGFVISRGDQFQVIDGCLGLREEGSESDPVPDGQQVIDDLAAEFLVLQTPSRGTCGDDGVPVGVNGIGDDSEGHICITSATSACVTCVQDLRGWTQTATVTAVYRADGSIDGVAAVDLESGARGRVSIRAGDQVTITISATTRYGME
jgi:hypothetical protein